MPKHPEKKDHPKGHLKPVIELLLPVLDRFAKEPKERKKLHHEVRTEGPAHKQTYSALLLHRAEHLIKTIENLTQTSFKVQEGISLTAKKGEEVIPVPLPASSFPPKTDGEEVASAMSHAPAHEVIALNALLQAIEWSIQTVAKHGQP